MGANGTAETPEPPGLGLIDQWLAHHVEEDADHVSAASATPERAAPALPDPLDRPEADHSPVTSAMSRLNAARELRDRGDVGRGDPFDARGTRSQPRDRTDASDDGRRSDLASPDTQRSKDATIGDARSRLAAGRQTQPRRDVAAEIFGAVNPTAPSANEPIDVTALAFPETPAAVEPVVESLEEPVAPPVPETEPVETPSFEAPAVLAPSALDAPLDALSAPVAEPAVEPVVEAAVEPAPSTPTTNASPGLPDADARRERLAAMVSRRTAVPDAPTAPPRAAKVEVEQPVAHAPEPVASAGIDPLATLARAVADASPADAVAKGPNDDLFAALMDLPHQTAPPAQQVPAPVAPPVAEVPAEPVPNPVASPTPEPAGADTFTDRVGNGKHKADAPAEATPAEPEEMSAAVMEPALQAVLRAVEAAERATPKKRGLRRGKAAATPEVAQPSSDPVSDAPFPPRPAATNLSHEDEPLLLDATVAKGLNADESGPTRIDAEPSRVKKSRTAAAAPVAPPTTEDLLDLVSRSADETRARREAEQAPRPAAVVPREPASEPVAEPVAASTPAPSAEQPAAPPIAVPVAEPVVDDASTAAEPDTEADTHAEPETPPTTRLTKAAKAKQEARKAEAARQALFAEVGVSAEPEPEPEPVVAVAEPETDLLPEAIRAASIAPVPAAPDRSGNRQTVRTGLSDRVEFTPRTSTQQLLAVLTFLGLVGTIGTGYLAYDSRGTTEIAIAGTFGLLTLILWSAHSTAEPAKLMVERGVLDIVGKDSHHRFDLASPYTEITVRGAAGMRNWQVQIARRSMQPYVIDSSMVDPREFMPVLERHRAEAERADSEAALRRGQVH